MLAFAANVGWSACMAALSDSICQHAEMYCRESGDDHEKTPPAPLTPRTGGGSGPCAVRPQSPKTPRTPRSPKTPKSQSQKSRYGPGHPTVAASASRADLADDELVELQRLALQGVYSPYRTLRYTVAFGVCTGAAAYCWYFYVLDWLVPGSSLGPVLLKTLMDNTVYPCTVYPPCLALQGAMEGRDARGIREKVRAGFLPMWGCSAALWVAWDLFMFTTIPASSQNFYVQFVSLISSTLLSFYANRVPPTELCAGRPAAAAEGDDDDDALFHREGQAEGHDEGDGQEGEGVQLSSHWERRPGANRGKGQPRDGNAEETVDGTATCA